MVAKHLQLALVGLLVTVAQRAAGQQPIIGFADPVIRNVPESIGSFSVCVELIDPDAFDDVLQVRVMAQGFNQPNTASGNMHVSMHLMFVLPSHTSCS